MKQFLNKFWPGILGLVFLAMTFGATVVLVRNHLDQETGEDHFLQLSTDMKFVIKPNHNNVNIVVLRLKNPGLTDTNPYEVQVLDGNNILVSEKFSGANVGDPSDLRIQFSPLGMVKNKLLTLVLRPLSTSTRPLQIGVTQSEGISYQAFYRDTRFPEAVIKNLDDIRFLVIWGGTIAVLIFLL